MLIKVCYTVRKLVLGSVIKRKILSLVKKNIAHYQGKFLLQKQHEQRRKRNK